ncbi:aldo/keto reductase [Micromonospora sp. 067-2]|uniref:aldo/keto reductase n=1 Tax=Micromonospora sp. 067-2 TaxID=2789270 RepID=UPI003979613B
MQYRRLGRSGTLVSHLCLGTMTFGAQTDEKESFAQLDRFLDAGGNFLDTADVYNRGATETVIGHWLAQRPEVRDRIVIATKGRFPMGDGVNDAGLSRVHLTQALDASLRRLGTDHVDLYQAHAWDPLTPIEETLRFYDDAVRAGKIRYAGVSNFTGWQLQKAALLTEFHRLAPIVTLQPQYNLLERDIEWEIVPVCQNEGIGILPWSPLGGGWLTGKYQRGVAPEAATRLGEHPSGGAEALDVRDNDRTWHIVDTLRRVADGRPDASMPAVAIAWVAQRPAVTSVILGARTLDQLESTLAAAELQLSEEEKVELDRVSAPVSSSYPYGDFGTRQRGRDLP